MHLRKKEFFILILIVIGISSLTPLLWFKPGFLIEGVDIDFQFFPLEKLLLRTSMIDNTRLGGIDASTTPARLFFSAIETFLEKIGFNNHIAREKILFIILFTLPGFSMYYFIDAIFPKNRRRDQVIKIFGILFYLFNFYQLHIWMIVRLGEGSGAIILPAMIGFLIRTMREKSALVKNILILTIFLIIGSGIGVQPPVTAMVLGTIIIFSGYLFLTSLKEKNILKIKKSLYLPVILLTIFTLINLYWILPVINFINESRLITSMSDVDQLFNLSGLLEQTSRCNSFWNVMRLLGDNVWFDGYVPAFFPYQKNIYLIFLSLFFPVLAFSSVFFVKRNRYVPFFITLTLIYLFISKGLHPPLGQIFYWLQLHFPLFWLFRAPWQKFALFMTLGYSFLAAFTCGEIYFYLRKKLKRNLKKIVPLTFLGLVIILTLVFNQIFLKGGMFPTTEERNLQGFHQKFPDYVFEASNWLDKQDGYFNILLLPYIKSNAYVWGYGGAADITDNIFFNKSIVFKQYGEGMVMPSPIEGVADETVNIIEGNKSNNAYKILNLLNIRYILQRNDFDYNFYHKLGYPELIRSQIEKQENISLIRSFGEWDIYEVKKDRPVIYTSENNIFVPGSYQELLKIIEQKEFPQKATFHFGNDNPERAEILENNSKWNYKNKELNFKEGLFSAPQTVFQKINPTKYVVEVKNVQEPFFLNLLVPYHSQWKAYISLKDSKKNHIWDTWFIKDIGDNNHFIVNGYANSWHFTEKGDYIIILEYWPQRLFYWGIVISLLTSILIIFIFFKKTIINHLNEKTFRKNV